MRKAIGKWTALCLTAAMLGGCGRGGEAQELRMLAISGSGEDGLRSGEAGSGEAQDGQGGLVSLGNTGQNDEGTAENQEGQRESGALAGAGQGGSEALAGAGQGDAGEGSGAQGGRLTDLGTETDSGRKEMTDMYISILEDIYFDQVFPGGEEYGYQPGAGYDVTSNSFAVFDIDFDGQEELIVTYSTTYMAGMRELIYAYDGTSKSVQKEFDAFPSLIYYDNGVVRENASHNHGMASDGAFWPYSLYQYDGEKDAYVLVASVDAWSRSWREEDYDGNPFPEEVDEDGDGLVYYVMSGETYEQTDSMDQAAYDKWLDSVLKGAGEVRIPYVKLTTDNIYGIK